MLGYHEPRWGGPSPRSRASSTRSARPPYSLPLSAEIAAVAPSASISTKPNPRGRPVSSWETN